VCVFVCLCVGHTDVLCENDSTDRGAVGDSLMGPRNRVLDGGQDRTNPFVAARGDKSAMWLIAKLLWTLAINR